MHPLLNDDAAAAVVAPVEHPGTGVVDVADSPAYDGRVAWEFLTNATTNLLTAARLTGVTHVVLMSVVGTGRWLASSYFRAKATEEQLIAEAGIPFSIVRVTQCYEALARIADSATDGDTVRIWSALRQPIAADDVASARTATALGEPVNGIREVAGPHRYGLDVLVGCGGQGRDKSCRVAVPGWRLGLGRAWCAARIGAGHLGHTDVSMTQDKYMSRGRVHTSENAL